MICKRDSLRFLRRKARFIERVTVTKGLRRHDDLLDVRTDVLHFARTEGLDQASLVLAHVS